MTNYDQRDVLWNAVYEVHYQTYYEELLIECLLGYWSKVDAIAKVVIALTSSSTAVAGWSMWNKDEYKIVWAFFAGSGAVLAILSSALGIQTKLKEHAVSKENFLRLRSELEILQHKMRLDPEFPVTEFNQNFEKLKRSYTEYVNGEAHDVLLCSYIENKIQNQLNERIKTQT